MQRPFPGIRALRTFEAAARHLNFTRAADEVGLTPAAVSYQIREIETQMGLTLFQRSSRRIRLTAAGSLLFAAAGQALQALHQASVEARALGREDGPLRLSLGARFATHWLLPRLDDWRAQQPDIELRFDITDRTRDFLVDGVDLAIRFGAGDYPDAIAERLFAAEVIAVASPALLADQAPLRRPEDLRRYTLCHVDCRVDGVLWPDWRQWMQAAGVSDFDDRQCLAFTDTSHVIQAVLDGSAVGLAERALIEAELASGRLVQVFDCAVTVAAPYAYHLVYPATQAHDARLRAFRAWLLAQVGAA